ncbi:glycosyltransferase family 2 protein [Flavobacterium sp. GSP14]|uniref:glycosyltransferase family 2 protein n=1 Tax=Flavobacterium sp. GSP14 TaxID=3401734 RepID=UPI003AAC77B5
MQQQEKKFAILIATKNRIKNLTSTLKNIEHLLNRDEVECSVFDDGSTDGTTVFIKENYPKIRFLRNEISKGLIFSRNLLLATTTAQYAISLDDDAHFLTENPLDAIQNYFQNNPNCGVLGFRIFWGVTEPAITCTNQMPSRVKGYVGCGHVWKMDAWRKIPNYPEWFVFYGEEDFAGYHSFKKKIEIHYLPSVLVHHRVDVKSRKKASDYQLRLRRSLRSGWYLYVMFYPLKTIPRLFFYSLWIQIRNKVMKGDIMATLAIVQALGDVIIHIPKLLKSSNRMQYDELKAYRKLADTKIYWSPEK